MQDEEMAQASTPRVDHRILVAYASEFGSTAEVAQAIAKVLRTDRIAVDVCSIVEVSDLAAYQALVIGSPIYNGQWLPEAVAFVQTHADALSRMPVAYFVLSMLLKDDTVAHRDTARSFLAPVFAAAPRVVPVDIGLFAGRMRYRNLPLLDRIVFWTRTRLPSGDFRDWEAILAWAGRLPSLLIGYAPHQ
jgi:menaquinone-dependent protoporphyrinogen oxidase